MTSNVILTKFQNKSGVFRFGSIEGISDHPTKAVNNIVISTSPGKVLSVERFHRLLNNFEEEILFPVQEEIGNVAIKHLKLSKRDRITVLR